MDEILVKVSESKESTETTSEEFQSKASDRSMQVSLELVSSVRVRREGVMEERGVRVAQ
jgi:hypothetical protein